MPIYEIEKDRFSVMYSGPLEVGACVKVVEARRNGDGDFEDPYARLCQYARELDEAVEEIDLLQKSWDTEVEDANSARGERQRLLDALVSIAEHLGAGHHQIACEGCDYEVLEVRRIAHEALGEDLPDYLRGPASQENSA